MSKDKYSKHMERVAEKCHVCHQDFKDTDHAVHHSGHVSVFIKARLQSAQDKGDVLKVLEGTGGITLHEECATILAMRLLHDVMVFRPGDGHDDPRVVDTLRRTREVLLHKGD